jgi:hypothetical protein
VTLIDPRGRTLRQVHQPGGAAGPVGRGGLSTTGVALDAVNRTTGALAVPQQSAAAELVQVRYDLTARPVNTVTGSGSPGFTNPQNAQGLRNGTLASLTGGVGAGNGTLTFTFPQQNARAALTVVSARVDFYVRLRGTVLNNARLRCLIFGVTHLDTTADTDRLTTPLSVPLPADWAEVSALQAQVLGNTNAASTAVVEVDAVEIVITAFREDAL